MTAFTVERHLRRPARGADVVPGVTGLPSTWRPIVPAVPVVALAATTRLVETAGPVGPTDGVGTVRSADSRT